MMRGIDEMIALHAGLAGYLIGSISFARMVVGIRSPGEEVEGIQHAVEGSDYVFESSSISATAVRHSMGTRYGCLTGVLDVMKSLVPALVLKSWFPDQPYFVIDRKSVV